MKILIIRFSSIGDIVLTTPIVRALKTQIGGVELHYATKIQYRSIFDENPYISKVHLYDRNIRELISSLRKEKFDYIIDLHNNLRTFVIKQSLRVKAFSFNKINYEKWLMVNLKINKLPSDHIVDRYLKTVGSLGVKNDALGLDYFIPDKDIVPRDWLPEAHRKEFVAYAIGAQHETKKLPLKKMIELCDKINGPIVLLGGQEDYERGQELESYFMPKDKAYEAGIASLDKRTVIFNACGKYNLNQSASIIKQARKLFTHDTGLMHIGAAFKKEVYSIWGNTIPLFGMYPYRTKFTVLENNNLSCRPCSKIGYAKCPKGHFKCMNDLTFDFYLG